ncbi:hypothetical protein BAALB65_09840 [Bacillus amyloliquefaciens]|nr:hypothetical protein A1R12_09105 [Bacillus amyloliquefaciens]AQP94510.1 hypothetical protein BZ167_00130 [Bacillus sp. 275]AWM44322.1 hypothetical protein BAALB65_09840 [Bacillus amyloliquefaciens]OAL95462.1 hypothetical protein AY610_13975 [Bacillus velezensis]PAC80062.1 hypothetical protein CHI11_03065 [Bacillus velezensis]
MAGIPLNSSYIFLKTAALNGCFFMPENLVQSKGQFTASIGIRAGSFACSAAYFVLADFPHPDPSLAPHL